MMIVFGIADNLRKFSLSHDNLNVALIILLFYD